MLYMMSYIEPKQTHAISIKSPKKNLAIKYGFLRFVKEEEHLFNHIRNMHINNKCELLVEETLLRGLT